MPEVTVGNGATNVRPEETRRLCRPNQAPLTPGLLAATIRGPVSCGGHLHPPAQLALYARIIPAESVAPQHLCAIWAMMRMAGISKLVDLYIIDPARRRIAVSIY